MVFLEDAYSVLLLAHLFATFVLVGAMSHHLISIVRYTRGKFGRERQELKFARITLWSYVSVYVLGALIYPAFRVYMRRDFFDAQLPWATGLFEVKEHWGALALALFIVCVAIRKTFQPSQERTKLVFYIPACILFNIIVWYKIVVGCYLSLLKGSFS